jgi:acyl-CoA synthetase (AMP-forming)/AMP-acid ligase II
VAPDCRARPGAGHGRAPARATPRRVGGFNAYPAEIEQLLGLHPEIADDVVGVPDARLGEVGKAHAVRRPGSTFTSDDLIAWSRREMANYKVPGQVEFVAGLPSNASGKVLKTELRSRRGG